MERLSKRSGWQAIAGVVMAAGLVGGLGVGCSGEPKDDTDTPASAGENKAARTTVVGVWVLDEDATRPYIKEWVAEEGAEGEELDEEVAFTMGRFAANYRFNEDGTYAFEILQEGARDGGVEEGQWETTDGVTIMDPDKERKTTLKLVGDRLEMIPGEGQGLPEGFRIVLKPAS